MFTLVVSLLYCVLSDTFLALLTYFHGSVAAMLCAPPFEL